MKEYIYMLEDDEGTLWSTSSHTIVEFDPEELKGIDFNKALEDAQYDLYTLRRNLKLRHRTYDINDLINAQGARRYGNDWPVE